MVLFYTIASVFFSNKKYLRECINYISGPIIKVDNIRKELYFSNIHDLSQKQWIWEMFTITRGEYPKSWNIKLDGIMSDMK